jgi:hypothetical protein
MVFSLGSWSFSANFEEFLKSKKTAIVIRLPLGNYYSVCHTVNDSGSNNDNNGLKNQKDSRAERENT